MTVIAPWPPTRFSEPLSEDFPSVFAKYRLVFRIAWQQAFGYELEAWQESLLCAITELRPDGHLRWRQVFVSLGRQNGKTEIGAALGLLFMLWKVSPLVIGIASSAEQARLVYDRVMAVILRNPELAAQFERITDTRGIKAKDGGKYELKASKTAALQGLPIDLGVVDEVHLIKQALWTDLVNGTGGRLDCLVVGITTAGDDSSVLLKHLYQVESETVGKFIWEAPESVVSDDDATLIEHLKAANPALASGRIDPQIVLGDVRSMPTEDAIRYRLNRFVTGSEGFISGSMWLSCRRGAGESFPDVAGQHVVFAVDRTPGWEGASITATVKVDGVFWSELVWTHPSAQLADIEAACDALARRRSATWVMDGYVLKDLAERMKRKGRTVRVTTRADVCSAAALLYRALATKTLKHDGALLLRVQVNGAGRKSIGDGFRIVAKSGHIDAVVATSLGVWGADTIKPVKIKIY